MDEKSGFAVDQTAMRRIQALRADPAASGFGPAALLRVAVTAGGCSGFQYVMEPAAAPEDGDTVFGDCVVIDAASLGLLKGSRLVFRDDMMGAQFVVENPNAKSGCGCGASFSVDAG